MLEDRRSVDHVLRWSLTEAEGMCARCRLKTLRYLQVAARSQRRFHEASRDLIRTAQRRAVVERAGHGRRLCRAMLRHTYRPHGRMMYKTMLSVFASFDTNSTQSRG